MSTRRGQRLSLVAAFGLLGLVTACGTASGAGEELPEFTSLDDTYQAVDAVLRCAEDAGDPPTKFPPSGGPTGEAVMCTDTVEVLWFDTQEAYDNIYGLYADTANGSGSVYFVEGRNWFVVDVAEVALGAPEPVSLADLEGLAQNLDAKYTVKQ
jgi:hypothetical protein